MGGVLSWEGSLDNVTFQEVLTPATTGVTIVSTKDGIDQNWESSTFTTNTYDAAGFTYTIEDVGDYAQILAGNDKILAYGFIDGGDVADLSGLLVSGTGNEIRNYTVVRCPSGSLEFTADATLVNTIADSITIADGVTVTGRNNLFTDAASSGLGTYSDPYNTTKWSTDPEFTDPDNGDFTLKSTSPAIDGGTRD
jgi:hypothetical protein